MSDLPRALRWYLWAVYLATLGLVGYSLQTLLLPNDQWHAGMPVLQHTGIIYLVLFVVLAYVGERTALSVTRAISQSLSTYV